MACQGTLTISLDFELAWGVRDSRSLAEYGEALRGARAAVPRILQVFEEFDVHATWATVGFLFFDTRDQLLDAAPALRPGYSAPELSPYADVERMGPDEAAEPLRLGRSLVQRIADTPHQELATHTFSHYYALEPGQSEATFRADLEAAARAAATVGVTLESLVFPRNQVCEAYLDVLRDGGIIAYRGNESAWMYQGSDKGDNTFRKRAARLADAHLDLTGPHHSRPRADRGLVDVPASRFLRPVAGRPGLRQALRRKRILDAMTHAARHGGVFHLWWHPHNFGRHPDANLHELRRILEHFTHLRDSHGMVSRTMAEVARAATP